MPSSTAMFRIAVPLVFLVVVAGCSSSSSTPAPMAAQPDNTDKPISAGPGDAVASESSTAVATAPAGETAKPEPTAVASATATSEAPAATQDPAPEASAESSATGDYQEPSATDIYPAADFTVTAEEFQTEYASDDAAWKQKYDGKVVEVRGQVQSYGSAGGNMIASGMTIMFTPEKADPWLATLYQDRPWLDHPPGSIVVIRGMIGKGIGLLGAGYIVSSETSEPPRQFTPQQLHERFMADPDALADELKRKFVSIKGTVTGRQAADEGEILSLGAAGQNLIDLHLDGYAMKELAHWQIGNEVVALAEFDAYAGGDRPAFKEVLPVSPLTDYPPLPQLETRSADGRDMTVRPFTAELLGRWLRENQRALLLAFKRQPAGTLLEVRGEVQSVQKAESSFGDEVTVRLKDSYGGLTSFEIEKSDAEKLGIQPGVTLTARGAQMGDEDGMTFLLPKVEVE